MPTYTYSCNNCSKEHDVVHRMTETPEIVCPECGQRDHKKIITSTPGFSLKGNGWYVTDFRNNNKGDK